MFRTEQFTTPDEPCPYLAGRTMRLSCFYARDVAAGELDVLLSSGWRTFGATYFRPDCGPCRACVPLRIPVADYRPSKSQRRTIRRNRLAEVRIGPLRYDDGVYEVYRDHSEHKFGKVTDRRSFIEGFCESSCPSLLSEYRVNGELAAAGFLDRSTHGLSSVYFCYRRRFGRWGLGVFSVSAEIGYARAQGLAYYYLGYWIADNTSMCYKERHRPNQKMDWETGEWS